MNYRDSKANKSFQDQDFPALKRVGAFGIDLAARKAQFDAAGGKGVDHEFQAIGRELEPIFGKRIWADFHRAGYTEAKIRQAFEICKKRGKIRYDYFRGILKKL
jgi:hypothetical protein